MSRINQLNQLTGTEPVDEMARRASDPEYLRNAKFTYKPKPRKLKSGKMSEPKPRTILLSTALDWIRDPEKANDSFSATSWSQTFK